MSDDHDPAELSAAEEADLQSVRSIPLDTEDGGTVVIEQQNMGGMQQVGGGEFKNGEGRSVDEAADEQAALQQEAPLDDAMADGGGSNQGETDEDAADAAADGASERNPAAAIDPDSPGLSALGLQDGDPVEPSEPA